MANDCFVDIDTIRYSVPHRLVKQNVDVLVGDDEVIVFDGITEVARHRRHREPHQRVTDPRHFDGIYRSRGETAPVTTSPLGRSLDVYAQAVGGGT